MFVSGCNLRCGFCQNYQISLHGMGRAVSCDEFVQIATALERRGAENINIVTGSHHIPVLAQAIRAAKQAGLSIPVLWNSSAYESPESLALLEDIVDMYLPDLKTLDSRLAETLYHAPDYPAAAEKAIRWMLAVRPGKVIVRHLVLPGFLDSTRDVLRWFADQVPDADLSLMTQYTPVNAGKNPAIPQKTLGKDEYSTVLSWLSEFGIERGFYQELAVSTDWLPDFNLENPFPSELSMPVWHWRNGFTAAGDASM